MSYRMRIVLLFVVVVLLWALNFFGFVHICYGGDRTYGNVEVHKLRAVYDGDTFAVDIKGWPPIIGKWISIRIADINTPELTYGTSDYEKAKRAKAFTYKTLKRASRIKLINIKRGRYFRIVATVIVDGVNLGDELIRQGLAKPYRKEF